MEPAELEMSKVQSPLRIRTPYNNKHIVLKRQTGEAVWGIIIKIISVKIFSLQLSRFMGNIKIIVIFVYIQRVFGYFSECFFSPTST